MKIQPLILGCCSSLLSLALTLPAEAAQLQFWRFDQQQNRLTFTTDTDVTPRVRYVPEVNQIVIDLPGIRRGQVLEQQFVGGAVEEIRLGRIPGENTRFIVELSPGYTLDPEQILVRGQTLSSWTLELPPLEAQMIRPEVSPRNQNTPRFVPAADVTRLMTFRVTPNGLMLRTEGPTPNISMRRSFDRRRIDIELPATMIPPVLLDQRIAARELGVAAITFQQSGTPGLSSQVPRATISLSVAPDSPDWQISNPETDTLILLPSQAPRRPVAVGQLYR